MTRCVGWQSPGAGECFSFIQCSSGPTRTLSSPKPQRWASRSFLPQTICPGGQNSRSGVKTLRTSRSSTCRPRCDFQGLCGFLIVQMGPVLAPVRPTFCRCATNSKSRPDSGWNRCVTCTRRYRSSGSGAVDRVVQRDRLTLDRHPPRVPGPDADHRRTASAAGPQRVCRSLQQPRAAPGAAAEPARARPSTRRNSQYARSAAGPAWRPDPRVCACRIRWHSCGRSQSADPRWTRYEDDWAAYDSSSKPWTGFPDPKDHGLMLDPGQPGSAQRREPYWYRRARLAAADTPLRPYRRLPSRTGPRSSWRPPWVIWAVSQSRSAVTKRNSPTRTSKRRK